MRLILTLILSILTTLSFAQQTDEQLGTQYFANKEYDKAAAIYEQLITKNPSSTYIYDNLLTCYIYLNQFDNAEKLAKKQQRRFSENYFYKVDVGYVYSKSGKPEKALKVYDELIKSMTGTDRQTTELANAFNKRNEHEYAKQVYLKGRKLNNNPYLYAINLAQLYSRNRDTKNVIEEYLNAISGNENLLDEVEEYLQLYLNEGADFDYLKLAVLRREKESKSSVYTEMLIWLYVQRKDYVNALVQAKALDKRFNEQGRRLIELAGLAMTNEKFQDARAIYNEVITQGKDKPLYLTARIGSLEAASRLAFSGATLSKEELFKLKGDYESFLKEEGRYEFTASVMRDLARLLVYQLHNDSEGIKLFNELLEMPRLNNRFKGECKLELGDIMVQKNEVWEAVLLYGQTDKEFLEDPLGQEAKFRNARLSYYIGEFDWARAQLDVLKTATSQLIANDALELSLLIQENAADSNDEPLLMFARADLLAFQHRGDEANKVLDSITRLYPRHSLDDDILYKRATIAIQSNQSEKSIELLNQLLKEYGTGVLGDNALFMMADITENKLGKKEEAKILFERFIQEYPGSFFLPEARKRFRELRGDNQGL